MQIYGSLKHLKFDKNKLICACNYAAHIDKYDKIIIFLVHCVW